MNIQAVNTARAGKLDRTFGLNGEVLIEVPGSQGSEINGLIRGPEDDLYITGTARIDGRSFFWISHLNSEGGLDTLFGKNGFVISQFKVGSDSYGDQVSLVENKILLSGSICDGTHISRALARFDLKGQPDFTFGKKSQGRVILDIRLSPPAAKAKPTSLTPASTGQQTTATINLLPDGKILVSLHYIFSVGLSQGLIIRLKNDGSYDYSFNQIGYITVNHPDYLHSHTQLMHTVVDAEGKYLSCGSVYDNESPMQAMFVRHTAKGELDGDFGTAGFSIIADTSSLQLYFLSEQLSSLPDGGVIGFVNTLIPPSSGTLIALDKHGKPHPGFTDGNPVYTRVEGLDTVWRAGTRQSDGKIIAVGATVDPQSPGHYDLAMARYLDNGTLDPAFNDQKGWVRTHLSSLTDGALAVTLQSTGNIIVGGLSRNHSVVVRYIG